MRTATVRTQTSTLERRIRKFYGMLIEHEFAKCYRSIDPSIRANSSGVTLFQYENALREFGVYYGQINVVTVTLQLHLDEPSDLYGNRDFVLKQRHSGRIGSNAGINAPIAFGKFVLNEHS